MTLVWSLDLPDSQKIVLLALADCANDEGHCWPSMASLKKKCSKGERTIQGVIKALVDEGHITRDEVIGKGCNYWVHPRRDCAPQRLRPAKSAPPQGTTQTPAAAADKPSRTINNGLSNDKPKRVCKPECVSDQVWDDFKKHRKRMKADITETALRRILLEADKARWTLEDALAECVTRGWRSFKAEWVECNDRKNGSGNNRGGSTRDAAALALERIRGA